MKTRKALPTVHHIFLIGCYPVKVVISLQKSSQTCSNRYVDAKHKLSYTTAAVWFKIVTELPAAFPSCPAALAVPSCLAAFPSCPEAAAAWMAYLQRHTSAAEACTFHLHTNTHCSLYFHHHSTYTHSHQVLWFSFRITTLWLFLERNRKMWERGDLCHQMSHFCTLESMFISNSVLPMFI